MPESYGAGRVVRRFAQDAPTDELYAFVECYDVSRDDTYEDAEAPSDYTHTYQFTIASTLPRVVYEPSKTQTMLEAIGKSGNLIVEEIVQSDDEGEDDE
jgi:FAS-associated factor 2